MTRLKYSILLLFMFVFVIFSHLAVRAQDCSVGAGSDFEICENGTLNLSGSSSGNFQVAPSWSQTGGPSVTINSPNSLTTSISGFTGGNTYTFTLSATCQDASDVSDAVVVTVTEAPSASDAGDDQTLCLGDAVNLSANTPTSGTGGWTQTGGASVTIDSPNSASSSISGAGAGTYEFTWTISTGGSCTPSANAVSVTISSVPTASAGSDQDLCGQTSFSLSGNTPGGGESGLWTKVSGPASGSFSDSSSPTSSFNSAGTGTYVFKWTVSNASCSSEDEVTITNTAEPTTSNAGTDQVLCVGDAVNLSANTPTSGTGTWTQTGGTSVTIDSPNSASSSISGAGAGTYEFTWTISTGGSCTTSADAVSITILSAPTASAGSNQNLCAQTSFSLSGNTPGGGESGLWTKVSGPASGSFSDSSSPTSSFNSAGTGTYVFKWTVSNASCSSEDEVTITNTAEPTTSNAGTDQVLCVGDAVNLSANTPTSGTGTWTQTGGTSVTIDSPSSPTSSISGAGAGTYEFTWTISTGGSCTTSADAVSITILSVPSANAGTDQNLCGQTSFSLSGNNPAGGESGLWTKVSGPAGGSFSDNTSPTSSFSSAATGTYVFKWTVSNASCSSDSEVTIINAAAPTTADAGDDQTLCLGDAVNLSANTPTSGTGTWTQTGGASVTIDSPSSPTSSISGAGAGTYEFTWTISTSGICSPSTDAVSITIIEVTTANAGADQNLYEQTSFSLSGNAPGGGESGLWTKVSGPAAGSFSDNTSPTSSFSSASPGTYVFKWTITEGSCSSSDNVSINNTLQPQISIENDTKAEGENLIFEVKLDNASGQTVSVNYSSSNSSTSNSDYNAVSGTLQFTSGQTSKNIIVSTIDDDLSESSEELFINLSTPVNATIVDNQAIGTIVDNDGEPTIFINDKSVEEGENLEFIISLSNGSAEQITVDYATADGTAKLSDSDYDEITTNTLTFSPSEISKTVTVKTNEDTHYEEDETMFINLSNVSSNASITDNQGVGTITNDDPIPSLSISNDSAVEGNSLSFDITLSNRSYQTVSVDYETVDGTATSGSDYTAIAKTGISFSSGELNKSVSVNTTPDDLAESNESFTVMLSNADNATITNGSGTGTITNDDNRPVLSNVLKSGNEDDVISFAASDFTGSFSDADGDNLQKIVVVNLPSNGVLRLNNSSVTAGDEINNSDLNKLTFTPNSQWNGQTQFDWNAFDGDNFALNDEQVIISIGAVNDAPRAVNDTKEILEDTQGRGNVLTNDSDADGDQLSVISYQVDGNSFSAGTTGKIEDVGEILIEADGNYLFTPTLNFNGNVPTIRYTIQDQENKTASANLSIRVIPVNDAPTAVDDPQTTPEDNPLSGTVTENDSDVDGDNIKVINITIDGTIYLTGETATITTIGTIVINENGSFTFSPATNFNGVVPGIEYTIEDTEGLTDSATLSIIVLSENDAPVAVDDEYTTDQNVAVSGNVTDNDIDSDGGNNIKVNTTPVSGPENGQLDLKEDGSFTYTPDTDYAGQDQFVYEICDPDNLCDQATVTIIINSTNAPPVANDDQFVIHEGEVLNGSVLTNDSDPEGGNLTVNTTPNASPTNGQLVLNQDGTFTYTPNAGFVGTDSFTYEVCDDGNPVACSVAKVRIDVTEILPVAVPDFAITETNAAVQINVFENDSTTFDPGTIIITQAPNNGQTSSDGSGVIIYTPNDGFDGEDSFIYEICDEFNRCDTAIVNITIEKTLLLYEVFTPNGDGQNDTYVIDGIENYPDNRFIVYNRWGNIVYEKKGYMNEWDGSSNSSIAIGNKPLPAGTYFYVIEYSEEKRKTGFIYIYR